ncbi:MAG TPA: hypothetical protein PLL09_07145 [Flavobacterium sp.]|uniref:hypothetical protein n=1 Tax=unclassified Flavobacterium TaxID=196869 RepID=UPI0025BFA0D8|nr:MULTISPECIES: hypothetical protein [unclassified Flavobacterium]HRE77584.1 hypothetical protein [Flavobacterium sp.]
MKSRLLFFALFCSSFLFAQEEEMVETQVLPNEIAFDFSGFYSPILSTNFIGFSMDIRYYVRENWSTGINISYASRKMKTDFQYDVFNPAVQYSEISWLNQFDLLKKEKFRIGLQLSNGLAMATLVDRDVTEEFWDEYGVTESAKRIETNYFYILQPGIEAAVRVYDNDRFPDVYLTAKAKYRQAMGTPKFATTSDFTNYYVGIGISLIGFVTY